MMNKQKEKVQEWKKKNDPFSFLEVPEITGWFLILHQELKSSSHAKGQKYVFIWHCSSCHVYVSLELKGL